MKPGINFPAFDTIGNAAKFAQRIRCLKDLGITRIRLDCHLYHLNPADGVYNLGELTAILVALKKVGIEVLLYLVGTPAWNTSGPANTTDDTYPPANLTKFVDAAAHIMKLFPEIRHFQIWNEQNTSGFWKTPSVAAYIAMVQAVRERFAADPDLAGVKIVMGGCAYLGQIDATGVNMIEAIHTNTPLQDLFDVVAYHPYTDPHQVWSSGEQGIFKQCITQNAWLHDLGIEVWATEIGKSTYPTSMPEVFQPHITETQQANYWASALPALEMANFDRVYVFRLDDREIWSETDRDAFYGFIRKDGSKKPAYTTLQQFCRGANRG